MSFNLLEIFSRKYLHEYISRNKYFILFSIALFLLGAIVGFVASESIKDIVLEAIKAMLENFSLNQTPFEQGTQILTNNIRVNLIVIVSGITFSLLSVVIIILNAVLLGFVATIVSPLQFVVGIFPHGIFELPATMLSLVGSLIVTKLEINLLSALVEKRFVDELKSSTIIYKDIILTVVIIIVLLVLAAVIEAFVTPVLMNMVA